MLTCILIDSSWPALHIAPSFFSVATHQMCYCIKRLSLWNPALFSSRPYGIISIMLHKHRHNAFLLDLRAVSNFLVPVVSDIKLLSSELIFCLPLTFSLQLSHFFLLFGTVSLLPPSCLAVISIQDWLLTAFLPVQMSLRESLGARCSLRQSIPSLDRSARELFS